MTRITVTFEDAGGKAPMYVRVRRLLKVSLRFFGLRVVDVREENKAR